VTPPPRWRLPAHQVRAAGRRNLPLLAAAALVAAVALPGCQAATAAATETVTVLGTWTGNEQSGFEAMIRGFEQQTGIQVDYTGTRDASAVLASDLEDGNPPDLAVLATPGELRQYAAAGTLVPLDKALATVHLASQYSPGWRQLMQQAGPSGARHYYAIIVKAALKSVIWYDPQNFPARDIGELTSPQLTWQQLSAMTANMARSGTSPWCMGFEDVSSSGWPGTDWIEDILLHQSGPEVYDQWVAGTLPWTSAPVVSAWQTFGQIADTPGMVDGGTAAELLTNYGKAGQPMFGNPPGCYLDHEGSFITAFYSQDAGPAKSSARPQPGTDFRFVPFPTMAPAGQGAEEVAGDLLGMFRNTQAARELIAYLTTPKAQEAWITRPGSGAISVNKLVPLTDYPDPVSLGLAENLTHAVSVRFDGSDSMPQAMENAFYSAVLEYLDQPDQLSVILTGLDQVRKAAY
jgi:alpha-glucoside transport system substrate-binding protein